MTNQNNVSQSLGLMGSVLREALLAENINEKSIVTELKKMLTGDSLPAKAKAIEIISKWANWNTETRIIEDKITISNKPEGLDI